MGRQISMYNAYLERWKREHPNVVEPSIAGGSEHPADYEAITAKLKAQEDFAHEVWADKGKAVIQHGGRFWGSAGPACPVYRLSDGRVVEETRGAQGNFRVPLYAVFNTETEWRSYDKPSPIHVYFERW